jgi:hypothetical protein
MMRLSPLYFGIEVRAGLARLLDPATARIEVRHLIHPLLFVCVA